MGKNIPITVYTAEEIEWKSLIEDFDEDVPVVSISDSEYEALIERMEKVLSGEVRSLTADEAIARLSRLL